MELNVFTWFLRKTNITWIFEKMNFSTNYYGIEYFALQIMLAWWIMLVILVGFWQIIPRVVTVFPVLQWFTEDAIQHHLLMIVEKVSVWRQICVTQRITENSRQYSSCFIKIITISALISLTATEETDCYVIRCINVNHWSASCLTACSIPSWNLYFDILKGLECVLKWWPEGLTQFSILENDE